MVPSVTEVFVVVLPTLSVELFTVTVLENMWLFDQLNAAAVLTPKDIDDQKTFPEGPEEDNTCPAVPLEPLAVIVFENVTPLEKLIGPPTVNDPDVLTTAELSLASGSVPVVMLVAFVDSVTALVYAALDLVSVYDTELV
jgi:hypothetical protein